MISYGHACSLFCKGDQTWTEVGAHRQNPNHPQNTSPSYTSPLPEYPLPLWKCRCRTLGSSGCQKSIMKIDVSRCFPFTSFTSIIIHPKSSRPKKHLSISPSISQLNGKFSRQFPEISPWFLWDFQKKRLPPSMTFLVTTTGSMYWGSKPWEATAAESTDCGIAKKNVEKYLYILCGDRYCSMYLLKSN